MLSLLSPPPPPPGPPSAPVNVISSVNGTSVHLEWDRPLDTGGRSDLQYGVLCQKCSGEGGPCESCDSHPGSTNGGKTGASVAAGPGGMVERSGTAAIRFVPRQSGLTEPRVTVLNLVAHSNYSFRILATNAVTLQSNEPSLFATANITTNQAGRAPLSSRSRTFKHHQSGGHRWRSDVCFYCEGQLGIESLPISLVVLLHNYYSPKQRANRPCWCAAPSEVLAVRQENASQNSVTLQWHEPDQPNGVILEYDIKYYEKVGKTRDLATEAVDVKNKKNTPSLPESLCFTWVVLRGLR